MAKRFDVVVSNGQVVSSSRIERVDIGIRGGKVAERGAGLGASAERVIDAAGKYVLPGAFDVHYHPMYGDPLEHGSVAAAHGGITSMVPFVYAYKGMDLQTAVDQFLNGDGSKSVLDFGVHLGVLDPPATVEQIPAAIKRGVMSFKFFLAYRRRGMMAEDDLLLRAMDLMSEHGGLMMLHAENGLGIDYLEQKFIQSGRVSPEWFERSRPKALEYEAVFRSIQLASISGCPVYLVHQTTGEAVEIIRHAQEKKQFVIGETCPQYLLLTNDDFLAQGPLAKLTPPYRTRWDVEMLWKGLADGTMATVGSDHSPHPRDTKEKKNVFDVPVGTPQVETMLPLLFDRGVNHGRLTLPRLVAVMCENPARAFGLYPRKGNLDVGADADVVIIDPSLSTTVRAKDLHSTVDYNTYEGWDIVGKPTHTLQRGHDLLVDGQVVAKPGTGQFMAAAPGPRPMV